MPSRQFGLGNPVAAKFPRRPFLRTYFRLRLASLLRKRAPKLRTSIDGSRSTIQKKTPIPTAACSRCVMQLSADVRPELLVLFAAVGLVLLIACVEFCQPATGPPPPPGSGRLLFRAALGAPAGRLIRQMLTESVLLSSSSEAPPVWFSLNLACAFCWS